MRGFRGYAVSYAVCGLIFLIMDSVWLTLMSERLYRAELGDLMTPRPRLLAAALFYVIYLAGVVGFAIAPALESGRARLALLRGAAFGFVAYATYDLTNQATLAIWSTKITVLDLIWGATVTALSAAGAAFAVLRFRLRAR
jgi:uncharacterized membrane protein